MMTTLTDVRTFSERENTCKRASEQLRVEEEG